MKIAEQLFLLVGQALQVKLVTKAEIKAWMKDRKCDSMHQLSDQHAADLMAYLNKKIKAYNDEVEAESRQRFEVSVGNYYKTIKERGFSAPGEGDGTPASLFWRDADGRYGIAQIAAAWWGWQMRDAAGW